MTDRTFHGCVAIFFMAAAIALAFWFGPDANWDLRSYHFYNAFAFVEWRYELDLMPVNIQSAFNPLIDLPYYLLSVHFGLRAAMVVQAMFFGVYAWLLWRMNFSVFAAPSVLGDRPGRWTLRLVAFLATLIGVTAAGTLSEVGTTFNDVQVSALVLAAVFLVVDDLDNGPPRLLRALGVGGLLGAAAALKLIATIYSPALVLAVVFVLGVRAAWRVVLAICAGWAVSFAFLYGWWGILVYRQFESPVFPLFNAIFRSPWYPPTNFSDLRFFPENIREWLFYPFNWAFDRSLDVVEIVTRDPRLAIATLALLIVVALRVAGAKLGSRLAVVLWFAGLGYAIWVWQFSILRYALPVEAVAGTTIAAAAALLAARSAGRAVVTAGAIAVVLCAALSLTIYPDWGRMRPSARDIKVSGAIVPDGSMVIVNGVPLGFVIPFVEGENLQFVGAEGAAAQARGYHLFAETARRIATHKGPFIALLRDSNSNPALLAEFGLRIESESCRRLRTNLERGSRDIKLCELLRLGSPARQQ